MEFETPELPHHLLSGLLASAEALEARGLRYTLIGGIATGYRSRPRFTQDVDLLLEVPQVVLPNLLDDLHGRGFTFDTVSTIQAWVRDNLAVLRFHEVRIDWLKPVLPLFQHVIDRATSENWLGSSIRIASAEGLILTKLLALRSQDLVDIENLLAANPGQLDLGWIEREWETVADKDHPHFRKFQQLAQQFYPSAAD